MGRILLDFGFGDELLHATPAAYSVKEKGDKLDVIKIKNFCSANDTANRMEIQSTYWEEIFAFAQHISAKGLVSKINKGLLKFKNRKTNNLHKT